VRHVDKHLRPFFGEIRASRLTTEDIKRYVKSRRDEGIKNSTINRELNRLKRALNLGRLSTPPKVKRLPIFPRLEEPPPRKGFFEHDQFVALREEMPEHLRPPITFAYLTGCRKGEILGLRWEQVDLARHVVRLNAGETKSGEGRVLPLGSDLFNVLSTQKDTRDQRWPACPWVFFRYGKRIKDFRGAWEEASKRAATRETSPVASLWGNKKPAKLFHDLRRTGARNLVRAGVPERVVMQIGGWKTRSVFDRYNIVSERDLVEAAGKLEKHLAEVETDRVKATSRQLSMIPKIEPS
jgi:integrase